MIQPYKDMLRQAETDLAKARAENERLRTIIDNLHAVEEKHRETADDQFHRANRLQDENERLTKERDEARAQVKVALQLAENMVWDIQPQTCTANTAGTIEREISSLTFSHASAALEAYGREKVREGMQRAAGLVSHSAYGTAYWAILADMETLK